MTKLGHDKAFGTLSAGGELKRRSVRAGTITAGAQAVVFVIRFGSTAMLARMVTPGEYGLVAMAAVVTGFATLFKDAGLTAAVIQKKELRREQASNLFWFSGALGLLLALLLLLSASLVANLYSEPRLKEIMMVMASVFIFGGFTVQHQALLRRQMRFTALALIQVVSVLVGVITAIVMARLEFGYWSLIGLLVVTAFVNLIGVWFALRWRPGLPRKGVGTCELLGFGGNVLTFNIVNYLSRKADNLLVGIYCGAGPLGLYDKAYSLLLLPISQFNAPMNAVAMPALSRVRQDRDRFNRYFLGYVRLTASFGIPVLACCALFADEIVLLWLGADWLEAIPLFRYLAVAAVLGALTNPMGTLLVSLGLTKRFRHIGFVTAFVIVSSFAIGLAFGVEGVAIAYSIAMVVLSVPIWIWALHGTPVRPGKVFCATLPSFGATALAAGAVALVSWLLDGFNAYWWSAAIGATVFFVIFAAVLLWGFREWSFFLDLAQNMGIGKRSKQANDPT